MFYNKQTYSLNTGVNYYFYLLYCYSLARDYSMQCSKRVSLHLSKILYLSAKMSARVFITKER